MCLVSHRIERLLWACRLAAFTAVVMFTHIPKAREGPAMKDRRRLAGLWTFGAPWRASYIWSTSRRNRLGPPPYDQDCRLTLWFRKILGSRTSPFKNVHYCAVLRLKSASWKCQGPNSLMLSRWCLCDRVFFGDKMRILQFLRLL